jgi:hypothetical protein
MPKGRIWKPAIWNLGIDLETRKPGKEKRITSLKTSRMLVSVSEEDAGRTYEHIYSDFFKVFFLDSWFPDSVLSWLPSPD